MSAPADKRLKAVIKEGGKRGVEIEGAAAMGGLKFFCTKVDEPQGDIDLLEQCVLAMNVPANDDDEERKGGSGEIGKMIFSAGDEQLAICAYVPEAFVTQCNATEWLKAILDQFDGKFIRGNDSMAFGAIEGNADKGKFPLKLRDEALPKSIQYLRSKQLFPEDDSDSEDEMVMGDDFFDTL